MKIRQKVKKLNLFEASQFPLSMISSNSRDIFQVYRQFTAILMEKERTQEKLE